MPPATAVKWAGQSIEILFRIYAAWLAGTELALRKNIDEGWAIVIVDIDDFVYCLDRCGG